MVLKQQQKILGKRAQKTQQSSKNWLNRAENSEDSGGAILCDCDVQKQWRCCLKTLIAVKAVEVLPWVTAYEKHYKSLWMSITF